ncbi:MAG: C_GCAxxG_C_C family protein [Deltaproteobacteria bacterium]|nr:C_GCAxxG_C_C family protein [Deltaproteobacteria bacterium]
MGALGDVVSSEKEEMVDQEEIKRNVHDLATRRWDTEGIQERVATLQKEGVFRPKSSPQHMVAHKEAILNAVMVRAQEYEYLTHSCSKGSALALMEAFGLGNTEIIRAMSPFPGFGMTGWICGGVTGGLLALGLYFGSDDVEDYEGNRRAMDAARDFIPRFESVLGSVLCPKIQEEVIFGRYMDPRGSREKFEAFQAEKGYEKCTLPPGVGARIGAEIIIEDMEKTVGSKEE